MPSELEHQRIPNDQMGPLCLADLEDIKPQYISNIVVNEWRREAKDELKYNLMTMSPTEVETVDCPPQREEFSGKLAPMDIKLSDAMATSAAAVSRHMGAYAQSAEAFKHLQTILGLGMGASMVADLTFEKRESCCLKASRHLFSSYFISHNYFQLFVVVFISLIFKIRFSFPLLVKCFKLLLICCLMIGNENYTKHFYFVLQKLGTL